MATPLGSPQPDLDTREWVNAILVSNGRLSGRRCLISNTDEPNCVDYTYCVNGLEKQVQDSVEYSWGMERGTLNPTKTPENIFRVTRKFDTYFGDGAFFFLPETNIIDQYFSVRSEPELFPHVREDAYSYTLLGHPDHNMVYCHRQLSIPPEGVMSMADIEFKYHPYPFPNFPPLISHIHPRFVILHAGQLLSRALVDGSATGIQALLQVYPQHKDAMEKIVAIYEAWTAPIGPENAPGFFIDENITPERRDLPLFGDCPSCKRKLYYDSRDRGTRDWPNGIPNWNDPGYKTPPRRASPICEVCYGVVCAS
ncbi:hypothetical protein GALMADRAFT_230281 [Galerina marginata CBS 339.88]|uniref:Uncharacterized protein n=1 Tax=Galerina marginata (strain CBS 339.88) TaxID=685588 RepID=A0A067SIV2_GALM3|nr:hypothetical protein GALMADRAFT_230281 [Galerina marginata CBS 339.88]